MNKIKKVVISNFRGISYECVFPTSTPVWLFGKNGTGKTSFIEALRFALTGKKPNDMIFHGADSGFVYIEFNDAEGTSVGRYFYVGDKANVVKVNDKTCTAKEAQKIICEKMNATLDQLDVLTSEIVFRELMGGDLGKFLLNFITEPFTPTKLYELVEFSEAEKEKLTTDRLLPANFDISLLESVYQTLFNERTVLKKDIAALEAKFDLNEEYPAPHFSSLDDLKKAEEEYLLARTDEKRKADAVKEYERALAEYKRRLARKILLIEQKEKISVVPEITDETVVELRKTMDELVTDKHNYETIIATNKVVVSSQQKILDALDSDVCPIASCLKCKTDKTAAKLTVEEALKAAQSAISTAEEAIERVAERINDANAKLKSTEAQLKLNKEYETLEKRIKDIDIGDVPKEPVFGTTSEEWKMFPAYKQEYEEYSQFKVAKETHEALVLRLATLSSLIKKFSPKGEVNNAIMKHYCDIFDDSAAAIADLFGYTVSFVPTEGSGVKLLVRPDTIRPESTKRDVDFNSLSSGEKLIASIIVYTVLNNLMGTGLLILDNFNDLDAESSEKARTIINAINKELGISTIFVAGCLLES